MKKQSGTDKLTTFGGIIIAVIIALVPFHAFLTVWIGGFLGQYVAARLWYEFLLVLLCIPVGVILYKKREVWHRLLHWHLAWLIAAYLSLQVVIAAVAYPLGYVTLKAMEYGLIVNLRFLWFFIACAVIASQYPILRQRWRILVLVPAALVVGFGLLQAFALPHDVLRHVGYNKDTIPAYQEVDQKPDYARVQSTLRGPNPLGAYLVIVVATVAAIWLFARPMAGGGRWALVLLGVGSLVVMGYTYSRSAYLATALTVFATGWLFVRRAWRTGLLVGAICLALVGGIAVYATRHDTQAQNIFFHTSRQSTSQSSNEVRLGAMESGLRDVLRQPFGRGPGTAGPASVYNNGRVRISENYYLQVGQEVGWLGLALFMGILVLVGISLYKLAPDPLAVMLFASLLGISLINMLSHAWTDDTLSMLWWGLAGIVVSSAILKSRNEAS